MSGSPIRMSQISDRKIMMSADIPSRVTLEMCNYARDVMNKTVVAELAKNVSATVADANKYWHYILELADQLDKKEGVAHSGIQSTIKYELFPKLSKDNLNEALEWFENPTSGKYMDKPLCRSLLEDALVIERIMSNHKALSKRFNFDKIAKETIRTKSIQEGVQEMCDLIETYDIRTQAKFNIALENITYAMKSAGYNDSIVEEVVDYFLVNEAFIPDNTYAIMQNIVAESRVLSNADKDRVKFFTEAKGGYFKDHITEIAEKCGTKDGKDMVKAALKVKNEKSASDYIKKATKLAMTNTDGKLITIAILSLPLSGYVSKSFVVYQFGLANDKNKVMKKINDAEFDKIVDDIMNDDDIMIETTLFDDDYKSYPDFSVMENSAILESDEYADSADIKACLNDFKKEQKKSIGRFRYYLGKIYRKSPENIIDETPNILSTIRVVFVLAPGAFPVIGPAISIVLAFVDKMLSMKINDKQSAALLKKLKSEKEKAEKDLDRKPAKKEELEKYIKCIDQCIKKVESYRSANIDSDALFTGSSDSDDELDVNFESGDVYNIMETTLVAMDAMNTIMEASKDYLFEKSLCNSISNCAVLDNECVKDIMEMAALCKRSIRLSEVVEAARYRKSTLPLNESVQLEGIIYMVGEQKEPESTVNDLVQEAYCIEVLSEALQVINEKASVLNKIKLALTVARGKLKDLSTKEKAMWKNLDIAASGFMRNVEKAMTSDRREAIIKGSIIPSFSKCIKFGILIGGLSIANPVLGIITAMGMIGVSKSLNYKERQLIYDEIDTELKVVEKEAEMAQNDGDMKKYRMVLQYQKRLEREKQRIKYGIKVHGRNVPSRIPDSKGGDDY